MTTAAGPLGGAASSYSAVAVAGGTVGVAITPFTDELASNISIIEPNLESEPQSSLISSLSVISGYKPRFGALLDWADLFANDMTFFANGIDYVHLYNNKDKAYRMSILAPKTALTATDTVAVDNVLHPKNNTYTSTCAGNLADGRAAVNWKSNSGTTYSTVANSCNNWQSVNEEPYSDTGYTTFHENGITKSSLLTIGVDWKLDSPSYTPSVDTGHSFNVRARYLDTGTPAHNSNLTVALYQGSPYSGGAYTLIKQVLLSNTTGVGLTQITTSFADYTVSLSSGEAALITDYTDLHFIVERTGNATGLTTNYRNFDVSHIKMTLPTTGSTNLAIGIYSYVYTYVRSATGCESGPSPALQYNHSTLSCTILDDIEVSSDPDVDYINIYRTTIGGGTYLLLTTLPNELPANPTNGWHTDCMQDPDLTRSNAIILDIPRKRTYRAGLPPRMRYLETYKNRLWGAGALIDEKYDAGTALFTFSSGIVEGTGTYWSSEMEGRSIRIVGDAIVPQTSPGVFLQPGGAVPPGIRDPLDVVVYDQNTYRIIEVTDSNTLVLDRDFSGDGGSYYYEIVDDRSPFTVYFSAPGFPEDFPVQNGIELEGEIGTGITGLLSYRDSLYIWTEDNLYRLYGNDESNFRIDLIFQGIGCVSGHTIVLDEETNLVYFAGKGGYYVFDGQSVRNASSSLEQGKAFGIDKTLDTVNAHRQSVCISIYDAAFDTVLNFTSLNGAETNESAICLNTQASNWSIDDSLSVVSAARIYDQNSKPQILIGDIFGNVYLTNQGNADACWEGTIVGEPTSSTKYTITCSSASFSTSLAGVPCLIIDGEGRGFRNRIKSSTATTLTLFYPLQELPNANYRVIIGYIDWAYTTGFMNWGTPHREKVLDYLEMVFEPQEQGSVYFASAVDNQPLDYLESELDLSKEIALGRIIIGEKAYHHKVHWRQFLPQFPININRLDYYLATEGEDI